MKLFTFIFICAAFLSSCKSDKIPSDVLAQPKMEAVLWDYICVDVYANEFANDSLKGKTQLQAELKSAVFQKHKITAETFSKSYKYYEEHSNLMQAMLDSVTAKQVRKKTKEAEKKRDLKPLTSQ